ETRGVVGREREPLLEEREDRLPLVGREVRLGQPFHGRERDLLDVGEPREARPRRLVARIALEGAREGARGVGRPAEVTLEDLADAAAHLREVVPLARRGAVEERGEIRVTRRGLEEPIERVDRLAVFAEAL